VVLNIRIDEPLAREIKRISKVRGKSESEVARTLLKYGAEVERRIQADLLMQPLGSDPESKPGRVVIEARYAPYTRRELWEQRQDMEEAMADYDEFGPDEA
jgi:hypothetical protein